MSPIKKSFNSRIWDHIFTDTFLLPTLEEVRFRVQLDAFGTTEGKKGWQNL